MLGGELAVPFARNPLYAGLNSRPRILKLENLGHFDRTLRNRRSRTSSGPEGSSDKWCGLCRSLIPICIMDQGRQYSFEGGCTTTLMQWEFGMRESEIFVSEWRIWNLRLFGSVWPCPLYPIRYPVSAVELILLVLYSSPTILSNIPPQIRHLMSKIRYRITRYRYRIGAFVTLN